MAVAVAVAAGPGVVSQARLITSNDKLLTMVPHLLSSNMSTTKSIEKVHEEGF